MLLAAGGLPGSPVSASRASFTTAQKFDKFYHGPDEVNLLDGLSRRAPQTPLCVSPFSAPGPVPTHATRCRLSSTTPTSPPVLRSARRPTAHLSTPLASVGALCLSFGSYLVIPIPATLDDALWAVHAERFTLELRVGLERARQPPEGLFVEMVDVTVGQGGRLCTFFRGMAAPSPAPLERGRTTQFVCSSPLSWSVPRIRRGSAHRRVRIFSGQGATMSSHNHSALTAVLKLSLTQKRRRVEGGGRNGRAFVPDATVFFTLERRAQPYPAPDRRRSAAVPLSSLTIS